MALCVRDTGIAASTRLGITDPVVALNLDLAITHRLLQFDNEKRNSDREFLSALLNGPDNSGEGSPG